MSCIVASFGDRIFIEFRHTLQGTKQPQLDPAKSPLNKKVQEKLDREIKGLLEKEKEAKFTALNLVLLGFNYSQKLDF
jgi:hypothetical protein